ncbi:MAG: putative sulfate exporter family transporter [Pirellulaceae bacterium]
MQATADDPSLPDDVIADEQSGISEDWLAMLVAGTILTGVLLVVMQFGERVEETIVHPLFGERVEVSFAHPLQGWLAKPGEWDIDPLDGLTKWVGILAAAGVCFVVGMFAGRLRKRFRWSTGSPSAFATGMAVVIALAMVAYIMAGQAVIKNASLSYALWALVVGLLVSNTLGTPVWLRAAAMTEFYIKTGLVLFGAELLFGRLLAFGLPGVCIAWVVTPIVLITTFWFGQRILKIESPTLNMVISADMSVCGVSAAVATSAACRAKKEELSVAISLSLCFTVIMMIVLPLIIRATGMSTVVGGAWMGGTIDATGAVVAAGEMLDPVAAEVAAMIKMIQNILIGVIAFGVAVYWTRYMESPAETSTRPRVGISEVWRRFPRFIIGFMTASLLFSLLAGTGTVGEAAATSTTAFTKTLRGWFFCLAFVSIGLETHFATLAKHVRGGKPIVLYIAGQSLNLCLTLTMAWVVFYWLFPDIVSTFEQLQPTE